MNKKKNWVLVIAIMVAAGIFALQRAAAPSPEVETQVPPSSTAETVTPTSTYEACGYMWAYHDDPQRSAAINEAIQALDASATARVQLFGEDCVYADGHSTFGAMETDFFVNIPVEDLTNQESMGNWIQKGMNIINLLPADQVQGRKGFIEFSFTPKDSEALYIHIEMNDYPANANDMNGKDLFQIFYTPPPPVITPDPITPTPTP